MRRDGPRHGSSGVYVSSDCFSATIPRRAMERAKWAWAGMHLPFDIPNLRAENGPAEAHVRIGWMRSVANVYHAYAVQSFTDELAAAAGRDRVEYLLDLLGSPRIIDLRLPNARNRPNAYPLDTARLRRVVELVADQSGWAKKKSGAGHGMGIAVHRSFLSYVATVVQVEVDGQGKIQIPRVDTVVDAGIVVSPERVRAQFEWRRGVWNHHRPARRNYGGEWPHSAIELQ